MVDFWRKKFSHFEKFVIKIYGDGFRKDFKLINSEYNSLRYGHKTLQKSWAVFWNKNEKVLLNH